MIAITKNTICQSAHGPAEFAASTFGLLFEQYGESVSEQRVAVWCSNAEGRLSSDAVETLRSLLSVGVEVSLHLDEPDQLPAEFAGRVQVNSDKYEATRECDCLLVASTAKEYVGIDPGILSWHMQGNTIFDVFDCLHREWFAYSAFHIHAAGRASLHRTRHWPTPCLSGVTEEGRFPHPDLLACVEA